MKLRFAAMLVGSSLGCACAGPAHSVHCAPAAPLSAAQQAPPASLTPPSTAAREPRFAYAVLKVAELGRSLAFYEKVGMQEFFRFDLGNGVTEVGIGFDHAPNAAAGQGIALVHEAGRTEPFNHGNAFGRVALAVPDVAATFKRLADAGVPIARPPVAYERFGSIVGFVKDPDGYLIEFLQPLPAHTP